MPVPVNLITTATAVAAGGNHSCARLADSTLRCWEATASGQLGDATSTDRLQATPVVGISTAVSVSLGQVSSCAAPADGTLRCWGSNSNAALGTGSLSPLFSTVPLPVLKISNAAQVSAGSTFACNTAEYRQRAMLGLQRVWTNRLRPSGIVTSQRIVSSSCTMDIDGDDSVGVTTDAVLLARVALGMSGGAVVNGTTATEAGRPIGRLFVRSSPHCAA